MTLIAAETLAKSAGHLYEAPVGTGAPAVADLADQSALEGDGWVHVGWLHEDGPELSGFEGDTTKHMGWNAVQPIRTSTRVAEPEVPVSLLQWNQENLKRYFPGATYTAGTKTLSIPTSGLNADAELLMVVIDSDVDLTLGFWFARTTARAGQSLSFPDGGDDLSPIPIIFDVLAPETDGDPWAKVVGIESQGS
jgi:hypothetical protein